MRSPARGRRPVPLDLASDGAPTVSPAPGSDVAGGSMLVTISMRASNALRSRVASATRQIARSGSTTTMVPAKRAASASTW